MRTSTGEIIQEFGPYPGIERVHGVSYDGQHVWAATGERLNALDPADGSIVRSLEVPAFAGTAFDGEHLYQIAENTIQKIDPKSGKVLSTIPTPGESSSGLTWAEGSLWIGQFRDRKILQVDPDSGDVLRTIESSRFVTGVTWADGELWHGTWEDEHSDLRHVDADTGKVMETLDLPDDTFVSGLEYGGEGRFYCGGGGSGKVRTIRRAE